MTDAQALAADPSIPQYVKDMAPKRLRDRHDLIAYMMAHGSSNKEIAEKLGYTDGRVSIITRHPRIIARAKAIRDGVYTKDVQKRFRDMLPKVIDHAENIMDNPVTHPKLRAEIAFRFMDRALGKPKEHLSVEQQGGIGDFFDALERMQAMGNNYRAPAIDVTPQESIEVFPSAPVAPTEVPTQSVAPEPEAPAQTVVNTLDAIDAWVARAVPAGVGIGGKK